MWMAWPWHPVTSLAVLRHQFFDGGQLVAASSLTLLHPTLDFSQLSSQFPWAALVGCLVEGLEAWRPHILGFRDSSDGKY